MDRTPLLVIEDEPSLERACRLLRDAPVIGVDTESDSMHHYREKVCLVQLSDADRDYIIDPLALDGLEPLGEILADPAHLKVLHGADYDIVCLKRDFGFQLHGLFDTMVASQLLGLPGVGLADLVSSFFGVVLDKRYQKYDWARRPLLPEHLDYARGDTHYLLALREILHGKLRDLDRLDVATEEFELLERREWGRQVERSEGWTRIRGIGELDDVGRRVLRALHRYREERAEAMDRPPYKVVPNQVLVMLARRRPADAEAMRQLFRKRAPLLRRHGAGLLRAIEQGLQDTGSLPEPGGARAAGPRPPHAGRGAERLVQRFRTWRSEMVAKGLPPAMLASNAQLHQLAGHRPRDMESLAAVPGVRAWQVRRYGRCWLDMAEAFERGEAQKKAAARRRPRKRRRRSTKAQE